MKNNLIKSLILSGCLAMTIVSCERKELPAGGLLLSDGRKVFFFVLFFLRLRYPYRVKKFRTLK